MDSGQIIVIIVSVLIGVWFLIGSIINRRRGGETVQWLRKGTGSLGEINEIRWIGSSAGAARLTIQKASAPFKRIEIVFLLESREILPLWLVNHMFGRRDQMIVKASLRSSPGLEIEAARDGNSEFKKLVSSDQKKPFERIKSQAGYDLAVRGVQDESKLDSLTDLFEHYPAAITRFSLQKKSPHLIVRVNLPPLQAGSPDEFFLSIKEFLS